MRRERKERKEDLSRYGLQTREIEKVERKRKREIKEGNEDEIVKRELEIE